MEDLQRKIDKAFDSLTDYINKLPLSQKGKNYIWFDSCCKFYDSYQPIDEKNTDVTYGIKTEWQLERFNKQFNGSLKNSRLKGIENWTEELHKIGNINAAAKIYKQLYRINKKRLLSEIGGEPINDWTNWVEKYLNNEIDFIQKNKTSIEPAFAHVEESIILTHREIATLHYLNGLRDLTYPQAEELALFYGQTSRTSGQILKERYWKVIMNEEGMNHKYNAEIYTHSNSYQSILKIIPLLEKEECIKLGEEYLKKSEPYRDVKSKE